VRGCGQELEARRGLALQMHIGLNSSGGGHLPDIGTAPAAGDAVKVGIAKPSSFFRLTGARQRDTFRASTIAYLESAGREGGP
jgi:hypothetical protein